MSHLFNLRSTKAARVDSTEKVGDECRLRHDIMQEKRSIPRSELIEIGSFLKPLKLFSIT